MSTDQYRVIHSTQVFTGRVISVRTDELRMSDGAIATREIVEHPGAVGVVALDEDFNLVLINQYRHPVRGYLDELPAGLLDVDGEDPLLAAQRELYEEAALVAAEWNVLVDLYTSPGISDEAIRLYLARGLSDVDAAERFTPEHEEITLTVRRVPLAEAGQRALAGELSNASAVAGVCAALAAQAGGWTALRAADAPWSTGPAGHAG
ncbi:MAG: NUDIX hydrolase [Actinomycetota bacterium]